MHEKRLQLAFLNLSLLAMKIVAGSGLNAVHAADRVEAVLDEFRRDWIEQPGHMRPLDDEGWKARMRALCLLAQTGAAAVPYLREELHNEESTMRVFAAQALGYLASPEAAEGLRRTASQDSSAAARLYAVDALGKCGGLEEKDLDPKLANDKNGDVRSYVRFALEREGVALAGEVRRQLADFPFEAIDTARLGAAAPDFTLTSARGKTYRLSDFRGKKTVVLIFIYGDT